MFGIGSVSNDNASPVRLWPALPSARPTNQGNVNNRHLKKGDLASLISIFIVAILIGSSSKMRFGLLHNIERGYDRVEKSMMNMDADHKRYKLNKH